MADFAAQEVHDWLDPEFADASVPSQELTIVGDQPGATDELAVVSLPFPDRVLVVGPRTARVRFSRVMRNTTDLTNPAKYVFTPANPVSSVVRLAADEVLVTCENDFVDGVLQQLVVSP